MGRLRGFLHHLAELAGDLEAAGAREGRRLDEEHVAPDGRHCEAGRDAWIRSALAHLADEAARPEPLSHPRLVDADLLLAALREAARGLAAERRQLPLEVADARLARVFADHEPERLVADRHLRHLQPVCLELLR